ncbi:MAG: SDR family NAD(P)-dependent oxidoreductase [Planctomycetaceae bacterium]
MRLDGKVVIVTGSATGIGAAIAVRAAEEGARVLVHGLEADLARGVAEGIAARHGPGRAAVIVEELAAPGAAERIVEAAVAAFGRIDGLVNNAALVAGGDLAATSRALFERMMAVNVLAPLELVRAALPWLERSRGNVVNIGSVNAHCGEPDLLPYSLSKAALQAATRNLGDTLFARHGVRVNQVNPGWVLTSNEIDRKRSQGLDDDWPARVERRFAPAGRLIAPEEIAAVVVTFLSDECGPVSGQVCDLEQYPLLGRNPPKTILPRDA